MKKILIAGANPYNGNKGVAALSYSAMILVSKILKENNQEGEILLYNHEFKRTFDSIETPHGTIHFRNVYPSNLRGIRGVFNTVISKWKLFNLKEFLSADYVLNISAGDSFSDIYGNANFCSLNHVNSLARFFGKEYMFLPQTYGPFTDKRIEKKAEKSLRGSDLILSRDLESVEYLQRFPNLPPMYNLIDLAFALPYETMQIGDSANIKVGVNISQTLWEEDSQNKFKLKTDYKKFTLGLIEELLKDESVEVHIIPHVLDKTNDNQNEYRICYDVYKRFSHKRLKLAPYFLCPIEAKSYISAMDLFIGARMHACIAAYSSNTPVIPCAYSRKFSGLFTKNLGYPYLLDLEKDDLSLSTAMSLVRDILDNRKCVESMIKTTNETVVSDKIKKIENLLASKILSKN